ncbi:MAG: MerR family transcriptional regulator [Eggerthellaceae bacterium]|nr:MerR family transcriptional regulator [Eggerthellaceae bacterium]
MEETLLDQGAQPPSRTPCYTIGEVSDMTGISAYTLRYYDKCGFFPNLFRGKNKARSFSDHDLSWLHLVEALRKSGLSIEGIQYFVRLSLQGEKSLPEQYAILEGQETVLEYQLAEVQESLKVLGAEKRRRTPVPEQEPGEALEAGLQKPSFS